MNLNHLKGFQEWKTGGPAGLSYRDDVIPAGVRARLEDHRQMLFDAQHDRAKALEFAIRVLQYATEAEVTLGNDDRRETRRAIMRLQRYQAVLKTVLYRNWLGLNASHLYRHAELIQLRHVAAHVRFLYGKIDGFFKREDNEYLADLLESLDHVREWIELETGSSDGHRYRDDTWEQLQLDAETVAALEARETVESAEIPEADGKEIMDSKQLAEFLGLTVPYLKQMRTNNTGPAYLKVKTGRGQFEQKILYDVNDVLAWIMTKPETRQKIIHRGAPAARRLLEAEMQALVKTEEAPMRQAAIHE